MELEEIAGAGIEADEGGNLAGGDLRLGEEGVGVELDGDASEDAPEHTAGRRGQGVVVQLVIYVLAILEQALLIARDKGIFVDGFARSLGDADRGSRLFTHP